jgi:hypothetical protein
LGTRLDFGRFGLSLDIDNVGDTRGTASRSETRSALPTAPGDAAPAENDQDRLRR